MEAHAAMRARRPARAAVGALMVALPASAMFAPAQSLAQGTVTPSNPQGVVAFQLQSSAIGYGGQVLVTGSTPAALTPQALELQFSSTGSSSWKTLAFANSAPGSRFRLSARMTMSGKLRVLDTTTAPGVSTVLQAAASSSTIHRVTVSASLRVRRQRIDVLGGTALVFRGRLLPGLRGRLVHLQQRLGHTWHTLASGHATAQGAFKIGYVPRALGPQQLRVRFSGDRLNSRVSGRAGRVTVFQQSLASWYYDRGATACGFNALYGVANRTLPCGTKVQFRLGSRTIMAVVDDRGPYIGGRVWDLGQNTAAALGFVGVETIWSTL